MNDKLLSIQEAADLLKVSTKTLRRWDKAGTLVPQRTAGNQRRYLKSQIDKFIFTKSQSSFVSKGHAEFISTQALRAGVQGDKEGAQDDKVGFKLNGFRKAFLISSLSLFLLLLITNVLAKTGVGQLITQKIAPYLNLQQSSQEIAYSPQKESALESVLGESTAKNNLLFSVNIPSSFKEDLLVSGLATFSAELTAPNVLYGLTAGDGLSIGSGQTPIASNSGVLSLQSKTGALTLSAGTGISLDGLKITNSDLGSSQKIFKTIKVGSNSFSSGSSTDTLEFAAGTGISLSANTTDKKVTITGTTDSGWTDDGTVVRLSTSTDSVGIGTTSPSTTLHVVGTSTFTSTSSFNGGVTLGDATSDTLTLYSRVTVGNDTTGNALEPTTGSKFDLGSSTRTWRTLYVDTLSAGTTSLDGSNADDFRINADNATADAENSTLSFERGTPATNAALRWNATGTPSKLFSLNSSLFINPDTGISYSGTSALIVNQIQSQDIFTASASGTTRFRISNAGHVLPGADNSYDIGSSSLQWRNLYVAGEIIGGSSGIQGHWQRALGALSPTNITDDLLIGATATSSAFVKFTGTSGNNSWINTGSFGIRDTTPDALLDIDSAGTTGGDFLITNTGVGTSGSVAQITSNSTTTGDIFTVSATGLTTGDAFKITGPSSTGITSGTSAGLVSIASDVGSAGTSGVLMYLAPDFSAGSATTGYGVYNAATDSTSIANTDYGYYGSLTLTGNAAKTGAGIYSTVTSSSTTADTLVGLDLATSVTGIMAGAGTRNVYGLRTQPSAGAESTAGTTNVYGLYSAVTADVAAGGTVNGYGLYVANGTFDTDGTSTQYGLYVESPTGADTNYAAIFAGGNVGIGTTAPRTVFDVTSGTANTSGDAPGVAIITGANTVIASGLGMLSIQTNDAMASGIGGSIAFGGLATSASTVGTQWAFIQGGKSNGTSGNVSGFLAFTTRDQGDGINEAVRIDSKGNVGIGTNNPQNKLDVEGGAVIGATYSGTNAAPTNGLLVQGNVGIGDTSPDVLLDILSATTGSDIIITNTNATDTDVRLGLALVDGTNNFTLGVDDSDNDTFKIGTSALETSTTLTIDSRTTTSAVSAITLAGIAPTIASAATAEYTTLTVTPPTITLTGGTQVTSQMDSALINQPTITDTTAITVDDAATLTIAGAAISGSGGSVTISDSYALKINTTSVDAGTGTVTRAYGLYLDAPTGAGTNYAASFATGNVGIATTAPASLLSVVTSAAADETNGIAQFFNTGIVGGEFNFILVGKAASTANSVAFGYRTDGASLENGFITLHGDPINTFVIQRGGNIGIGDTRPDARLDILATGAANNGIIIAQTNAGDYDPFIDFQLTDETTSFRLGVDDSDNDTFKIGTTALETSTMLTLDSRTTTSGVSAITLATGTAPTIASAATAYFNSSTFTPGTVNFSGSTQITSTGTSANNALLFNQPTINRTDAATNLIIDQASNLFINGPTIASHATVGQTETITASSALRIGAGSTVAGTRGVVTSAYGLYVDAPTGATNNYAATFATGSVGIGTTSPVAGGGLTIAPAARTSGTPSLLTITGPADTTLAATVEANDVYFNLGRTAQFATGAITTQRAVRIAAPTYAFVAASTITNAATLYVDAAPTAGTNATVTNPYALWVDAGTSRFDGTVNIGAGTANALVIPGIALLTGAGNSIAGSGAGAALTSGTNNTLFGVNAGNAMITGTNTTFIGYQAGLLNTANSNTAVGASALDANTTGGNNVAVGNDALGANTTGSDNVAISLQALNANTIGVNNIAIGTSALALTTFQNSNIAIGTRALDVSTGYNNIAIGTDALGENAGASGNIGIGVTAGDSLTTGAGNIILGNAADASSATASNEFVAGGSGTSAITNVYFGEGPLDASPLAYTINGTGGSGTNIAGAALQLAGGKATGNATGGSIIFQTADAGASGTTLQSLTTKMTLTAAGNVGIGDASPDVLLDILSATTGTDIIITNTNATDTDVTVGFALVDGTNNFTLGVDDSDGDKFKISTTALGTSDRFIIDSSGLVGIAGATPLEELDVEGQIQLDLDGTTDTTIGVCKDVADAAGVENDVEFTDCSSTPGDIAEWYETEDGVESGDLLVTTSAMFGYEEKQYDPRTGLQNGKVSRHSIPILKKSSTPYETSIIGIVSTSPYQTFGEAVLEAGAKNPEPVALAGRVPVKVSLENGSIEPGDYLTSSSTPGVAMKATKPGMVVGMALEPLEDGDSDGKILVFINPHWQDPSIYIAADGNLNGILPIANTTNTTNNSIEASASAKTTFDLASDPLFKDLSDKVSLLEARINNLTETSFSASTSAILSVILASEEGARPESPTTMGDSGVATLPRMTELETATISGTLMVLGRTTVSDLGVTGNINVGLLSINGLDGTVNTLAGDLKLQSEGLAGIDILAGKITIDAKGNMVVAGTITASKINIDTKDKEAASIGTGIIAASQTSVAISSASATKDSRVFVTATTPTGKQSLFVKEKNAGVGFVVGIEEPYNKDITFDWWVVN